MTEIPTYKIIPVHTLYDDDIVRAIGELFLDCASAEATLTFILNELESYPHPPTINGLAVITGMPNKLMLEKIGTLISIIAPAEHHELEALCTKIRRIFEHRNNIAHSTALRGKGKRIAVMPLKIRPPVEIKEITYTADQLRGYGANLLNLIRHLSERLRQLGLKHLEGFSLPKFLGQAGQILQDRQPNQ